MFSLMNIQRARLIVASKLKNTSQLQAVKHVVCAARCMKHNPRQI